MPKGIAINIKSKHQTDFLQSIVGFFEVLVTLKMFLNHWESKNYLSYFLKSEITQFSTNIFWVEFELILETLFFLQNIESSAFLSKSLCQCLLLKVFHIFLIPPQAGTCVLQKFKAPISTEKSHRSFWLCGFVPQLLY